MIPPDPLLQTLLRDPTAGVLLADAAGGILRANETLRGMVPGDVSLAPGAAMADIFGAAEREGICRALADMVARNTPGSLIGRLRTDLVSPHHAVAITALPLVREDGAGFLLLRIADITAQRQLESQLAQGQKLQAIGQLAGGIAHDFNNLLTAILGAAEAMRDRAGEDAETREDLARITGAAERGAALVRQLLAFGRQQTLQPRVIGINAAIRDIAGMLRSLLGAGVRLELTLDREEPLARVDPTQFDRVLVNLAVNARDAMADGGLLTLHSGHVCLFRPLTRGAETIPPGSYVMVEIRDTGAGIPADVLPRIFEPFFTTKREQGGTGLGLATVHGIVRQSGGFLIVDSMPGQGTSLRLYLPRAAGPADALAPSLLSPAPVAAPGRGRMVLLVDDEAMVRDLAARALRHRGWEVLAYDSAESALAAFESGPPLALAAVISDVVMPGLDGPALVRRLRAQRPGLPAILISGYAQESLRAALIDDGIAFLPKPYALKDLLALVARVIGSNAAAGTTA